jgi:hypothetical protein
MNCLFKACEHGLAFAIIGHFLKANCDLTFQNDADLDPTFQNNGDPDPLMTLMNKPIIS